MWSDIWWYLVTYLIFFSLPHGSNPCTWLVNHRGGKKNLSPWTHESMKTSLLHFDGSHPPFWACLDSLRWIYNPPPVAIDRLFPLVGEVLVTEGSGWFFHYKNFPPTYFLNCLLNLWLHLFFVLLRREETGQETEPFSSSIYRLCSHWRGTRPEWTWWRWSVTGGRSFLQGYTDLDLPPKVFDGHSLRLFITTKWDTLKMGCTLRWQWHTVCWLYQELGFKTRFIAASWACTRTLST